MLDAVVISDLHLGSPLCRVDVLDGFLENLAATKRLILNGDVMQREDARLPPSHWAILARLRRLAWLGVEVTWIAGNHDADAGEIAGLVGALYVQDHTFECAGKTILAVHGHQWDDTLGIPIVSHLADVAHLELQRRFPGAAARLKRTSKWFGRCRDRVRAGAVELARQRQADVVLCGHTHEAESDAPAGYHNSGSWTEAECHYLAIGERVELRVAS